MSKQMRFNDKELSLIKNTFAENDELLKLLRKVFLQVELTEADVKALKPISSNDAVLTLLHKIYAPEIELEAPFGQVIDLWLSVDTNNLFRQI